VVLYPLSPGVLFSRSLTCSLSLRSLETLFGKNMLRACKIVDERGVRRVTGAPSGRSLFLVGAFPPRLLIPPDVSCSSQTSEQPV
jgi:hypothetical protein